MTVRSLFVALLWLLVTTSTTYVSGKTLGRNVGRMMVAETDPCAGRKNVYYDQQKQQCVCNDNASPPKRAGPANVKVSLGFIDDGQSTRVQAVVRAGDLFDFDMNDIREISLRKGLQVVGQATVDDPIDPVLVSVEPGQGLTQSFSVRGVDACGLISRLGEVTLDVHLVAITTLTLNTNEIRLGDTLKLQWTSSNSNVLVDMLLGEDEKIQNASFWTPSPRFFGRNTTMTVRANFYLENMLSGQLDSDLLVPTNYPQVHFVASYRFDVAEWLECPIARMTDCALSAQTSRPITCETYSPVTGNWTISTSLSPCILAGVEVPISTRTCKPDLCESWIFQDWSECTSSACGVPGSQKRNASCMSSHGVIAREAPICAGVAKTSLQLERSCNFDCSPQLIEQTYTSIETGCKDMYTNCVDENNGMILTQSSCNASSLSFSSTCPGLGAWDTCTLNQNETLCTTSRRNGTNMIVESRPCNCAQEKSLVALGLDESKKPVCYDAYFAIQSCATGESYACGTLCDDVLLLHETTASELALQQAIDDLPLVKNCAGIVSPSGKCCKTLDKDGQCCQTETDACGVCGGANKFIDFTGKCCAQLDAAGYCCDLQLDALGVCGGTTFGHPEEKDSHPICGNGVCEAGEICHDNSSPNECCSMDCPFQRKSCPIDPKTNLECGGRGKCLPSLGQCDCFKSSGMLPGPEYSCASPKSCDMGYLWTAKGCVLRSVAHEALCQNQVLDIGEEGVDCGGICVNKKCTDSGNIDDVFGSGNDSNNSSNASDIPTMWIAIISAFGAVTFCLCVGFFYYLCLIRQESKANRKKQVVVLQSSKPEDSKTTTVEYNKKVDPINTAELDDDYVFMYHDSPNGRVPIGEVDFMFDEFELGPPPGSPGKVSEASPVGGDDEWLSKRLAQLQLREELLAKDVAMEGWLKHGKSKDKIYVVLKPVGELLFYKDMLPSGFGNVHINHFKTINIRHALSVSMTKRPVKKRRGSAFRRNSMGSSKSSSSFSSQGSAESNPEGATEDCTGFHIIERIYVDHDATKIESFKAPDAEEARQWVTVLDCLIQMYKEQNMPSLRGMTPHGPAPAFPNTPQLPNMTRVDEFPSDKRANGIGEDNKNGDDDDDDPRKALRKTKSEPNAVPPQVPLPPKLPAKVKSSSSKSALGRRRMTTTQSHRPRSISQPPVPVSHEPPPLPPWPANPETIQTANSLRSLSTRRSSITGRKLKPGQKKIIRRPRSNSDPGEAAYHRNNKIWERFQNKL